MTKQTQSIQSNNATKPAGVATANSRRRKTSGGAAGTPGHERRARSPATSEGGPEKNAALGHADAESGESVRTTKQETVLSLLSRGEGASIEEIMSATGWQQHSVRGFFAGTVKKKLRFNLESSRAGTEARRYRIETRKGKTR